MRAWWKRAGIAACWLALTSPLGSAQEPYPPITPPVERQAGTPLETLESFTGERREPVERPESGDEIETDRDSFTPATTTAGRRRLIVESAYSFLNNRGFKESHSFPELILRYGLTDRVELRLGWNADIGGSGNDISSAGAGSEGDESRRGRIEREYSLAYGAKIRLTGQSRWVPQSALIVQGFTPTGGSAGTPNASRLIATYVAGWQFPNRWKFDTAMRYGYASESGDHFNQWSPSAVLRVPLGEKWSTHAEYFGIVTTGRERNSTLHFVSTGMHYLVTPDLEIGVRVGWGLNDPSARFFANAGFGWRF
jgi:hypothetical protein